MFAAAGRQGATMTAICAHAKLTERYFYESFTSRDELLQQVFDGIVDEVRVAGMAALRTTDGHGRSACGAPLLRSSTS